MEKCEAQAVSTFFIHERVGGEYLVFVMIAPITLPRPLKRVPPK
jgi:hypothetical protein